MKYPRQSIDRTWNRAGKGKWQFALVAVAGLVLVGCQSGIDGLVPKHELPVPASLVLKMKAKGMAQNAPIMLRIFKVENEMEVWKQTHTGRYALLNTYEICKWSGKLGPKFKEGDRQAPEGFYHVNKRLMNPNSSYHLSFNMGFPNTFDRAHDRTGTYLMIHGACSSAGCYSMTDEKIEEIYALARDAFKGGQKDFQIQAMPFRMTPKNMVEHRDNPHFEYWKMLKRGYDHFEITRVPPKVDVCNREYVFNTQSDGRYASRAACPAMTMPKSLALAYTKKQTSDARQFEKLLAKAEKRSPVNLAPMTYASALPGISFEQPVADAATQPDVAKPNTGDATKSEPAAEAAAKAPAPKPATPPSPSALTPLENTIRPAG